MSLTYTSVIILGVHICKTLGLRSWRIFALISLPGDLTIMGLCIAKITILSFSGLPADCHGLTRDNCKGFFFLQRRGLVFCFCSLRSRPLTVSTTANVCPTNADDGSDLVRQPADGYSTIRFGSWANAITGELDSWCTFPRTVYGLSVVAM